MTAQSRFRAIFGASKFAFWSSFEQKKIALWRSLEQANQNFDGIMEYGSALGNHDETEETNTKHIAEVCFVGIAY